MLEKFQHLSHFFHVNHEGIMNIDRTNTVFEVLERFSFECRKVIGFAFTTLRDWFKKLAPLFHPIRSKTKTNRDSLVPVFPHFTSATCNNLVFWLVHLIICVLCDWLEWLLWFWSHDTQLKTSLLRYLQYALEVLQILWWRSFDRFMTRFVN